MKINAIEVDTSGSPSPELAAIRELLRQRAVQQDLLASGADAKVTDEAMESLLQREVDVPDPTEDECRRWYDTHLSRYVSGELVHARHILFQVTPGIPVGAIRSTAEAMLKDLRKNPERFSETARSYSNCPSGQEGGQLGQLQRGSTVPEFEKAVFDNPTTGILPELVRTRFGFHIVAVDQRIPGEQLPFEAVRSKIADHLRRFAEERALRQYVQLLAGHADVEGVELGGVATPLVQ
ncbi:MAG TPA: peptidylprolyl isomerase [Nevskiaceae bacterium]|nr:peptidylprolyl isomerase [Nevskiaceae bacterium]